MSPFVCLFKPVVYGLYAGAQLTEYGGDLFLFVGRNEPFAFAAGEVEAAARKAALYLPSHLAYRFAGHFVIQLRHSAGVPAGHQVGTHTVGNNAERIGEAEGIRDIE